MTLFNVLLIGIFFIQFICISWIVIKIYATTEVINDRIKRIENILKEKNEL